MKPRPPKLHAVVFLLAVLSAPPLPAAESSPSFPVVIRVDATRTEGTLKPIWRFFGADEPNYATMKDGRKLLRELGALGSGQVCFRAHNLLNSGDGTPAFKWGSTGVYTEDGQGRPVHDWTIVDRIFSVYLEDGNRPYVEIGFMPQALSIKPEPYRHEWRPGLPYDEIFTGWAYPPKDYGKWAELVYEWTKHCVDTFGREEVEKWYWETWNEANIPYWQGKPDEFYKLHDYAIDAVRRALPTARVGGPDCAGYGGAWMRAFLDHSLRGTNYATGRIGTPLDFVSFHAKGAPVYTNGHVQMGIATQLQEVDRAFALIASYPELKKTPIVIGECDPEGCAACQGPQLAYRNGTMYSSYTAEVFARLPELAARRGVNLEGALTWAFEFEDQPYFAGFRALASCGIDLPVLNVFRMFGKMRGERVAVESSGALSLDRLLREGVRGAPEVSAVAALESNRLAILVWHYHDEDVPGPDGAVELTVRGLAAKGAELRLTHYRVDERRSNAYAEWLRMGSPTAPDRAQYDRLQAAGRLATLADAPVRVTVHDGVAALAFRLPRRAVSLVVLESE
jgi:xylan 1,4-beta-xylosidase